MSRIVYVNGEFLPEQKAKISVFDRGFLFADGIYEVTSVIDGKLIDNAHHLARLERSARELELNLPLPMQEIEAVQHETVRRNGLDEGMLYLQVTRGAADRDFAYPQNARPSLVMFTQAKALVDSPTARRGLSVITLEDIRWRRRDIKTVQLLFPAMAKQAALKAGADDSWLVENGMVTEGTSNNAWIIANDTIITRQLSNDILHGITRRAVARLAANDSMAVEERGFTVDEAVNADEAFVTSASSFVTPVVRIDGKPIGKGTPGPVTNKLRQLYIDEARKTAK
jgi:D-alanine transaminase